MNLKDIKFKKLSEEQVEHYEIVNNRAQRLHKLKVFQGPWGITVMLDKTILAGHKPGSEAKLLAMFPLSAKYLLTLLSEFAKID